MSNSSRSPSFRLLFWSVSAIAGLALVAGGILVVRPIAEQRWGPFCTFDQVCQFCGESQHLELRRGSVVKQIVTPNETSRWVQSLHPGHTTHTWVTVSTGGREEWFAHEHIACGANPQAAGPQYAYLAIQRFGDAEGQHYLARFHAALALPGDELLIHVQQMGVEIMATPRP